MCMQRTIGVGSEQHFTERKILKRWGSVTQRETVSTSTRLGNTETEKHATNTTCLEKSVE